MIVYFSLSWCINYMWFAAEAIIFYFRIYSHAIIEPNGFRNFLILILHNAENIEKGV